MPPVASGICTHKNRSLPRIAKIVVFTRAPHCSLRRDCLVVDNVAKHYAPSLKVQDCAAASRKDKPVFFPTSAAQRAVGELNW